MSRIMKNGRGAGQIRQYPIPQGTVSELLAGGIKLFLTFWSSVSSCQILSFAVSDGLTQKPHSCLRKRPRPSLSAVGKSHPHQFCSTMESMSPLSPGGLGWPESLIG